MIMALTLILLRQRPQLVRVHLIWIGATEIQKSSRIVIDFGFNERGFFKSVFLC